MIHEANVSDTLPYFAYFAMAAVSSSFTNNIINLQFSSLGRGPYIPRIDCITLPEKAWPAWSRKWPFFVFCQSAIRAQREAQGGPGRAPKSSTTTVCGRGDITCMWVTGPPQGACNKTRIVTRGTWVCPRNGRRAHDPSIKKTLSRRHSLVMKTTS